MSDALDVAAGLVPGMALFDKRRARPEFVRGAELCSRSVLTPVDGLGLPPALRMALACRIARLNADDAIATDYEQQLAALDPTAELSAIARGSAEGNGAWTTIVRHVDMVTLRPIQARETDIVRLADAGLTTPQIVALSELIAFVNFQVRVAAGLRLLRPV